MKNYHEDGSTREDQFNSYMEKVDLVFGHQIGLSYMDVEDYCWYDMFEDSVSPEEAVSLFFEDNYEGRYHL